MDANSFQGGSLVISGLIVAEILMYNAGRQLWWGRITSISVWFLLPQSPMRETESKFESTGLYKAGVMVCRIMGTRWKT